MATIAIGINKQPGGGYTSDVPVSALAEGGVPPEEGDSVSFSVEGKVQSVTGQTATVSIDSINGEPVGEEGSESPAEEGAEPETGAGGPPTPGGGTPPTPVAANGPNFPGSGLGAPGLTPKRRANMAGIAAMGKRLRQGAKGQSMPF
jgi:hypothetical protein